MQDEYQQEKLSCETFANALRCQVTKRLGTRYQVEQTQVQKNNGVRKETLLIREESAECAPSFYLEEMYRSYCAGQPVDALAEHIVETVKEENCGGIQESPRILEKEWFEERLFLRLVNFEKNKEQLETAVYVKVLDLAAVFYVLTEQSEDGIKSFCLPKSAWLRAELGTAEEYYDKILKNTERLFPFEIMRMEEGLLLCMQGEEGETPDWLKKELEFIKQEEKKPLFYIVTNHAKVNGAVAVLYQGVLERLAEQFMTGFYIIPSSVHEVLLLLESKETAQELNQMVREVNETQVAPEEVLSDHVYFYKRECGFFGREE